MKSIHNNKHAGLVLFQQYAGAVSKNHATNTFCVFALLFQICQYGSNSGPCAFLINQHTTKLDHSVLLGGLYFILQGTAGMAFGGSRMTSMAIIGVVGLVIIVLFAFLFLPQLGEMLKNFQPQPPF